MTNFAPGGIANRKGDIYGSSPFRIIRHGRIVIDAARAGAAIMCGWRNIEKTHPSMAEKCDPDFAWLERTEAERETYRP